MNMGIKLSFGKFGKYMNCTKNRAENTNGKLKTTVDRYDSLENFEEIFVNSPRQQN